MEKLLTVFALDLRTRNKLRNIILHLREHGKTVDDFIEYANTLDERHIRQIAENEKYQAEQKVNSLPCPECNLPMALRPVNIDKATQTGDDSKSVWICGNNKCMHTIYSLKTVEEILKELKEGK